MPTSIKGLKAKDLRKLHANTTPDMSVADFNKLQKKHSDITKVKKLKSPAQRITALEKEVAKLRKEIASLKGQYNETYGKVFNLELRVATLIGQGKDES